MDRYSAVSLKILRPLSYFLLLALILAVIILGLTPSLVYAQDEPYIKMVEPNEGECGSEMTLTIIGGNLNSDLVSGIRIPEGIEIINIWINDSNPEEMEVEIFIFEDVQTGPRPVEVIGVTGQILAVLEEGFTVICPQEVPPEVPPEDGEPPDDKPPPPDGDYRILILILSIVVAGTVLGISISRTFKIRRRKKWHDKAKEEEPPKECQPCTYYCRKIELKLEIALRKITHLIISAYDPSSGEKIEMRRAEGRIIENLNKAVIASRLKEENGKLKDQLELTAQSLLKQIIEWLPDKSTPSDITITGHLEGGKATFQFILYHCRRIGTENVWKKVDKWKATIKDKRDIHIGDLYSIDSTKPDMVEKLKPELNTLLMQFIEKV